MMTPRPNMIRALAAELAAGHTTSIALTEAALARAQSHRAAGGAAYIDIDARAALDMARAADAARAAGNVPSLLAGLPVSIKDLFDVAGQVTAAGSRALAHQSAATSDATAVARLRAAGAVLLGRTNMSEFAFSGLGLNPHYGTPRTPADGTRAAGGSTSGGAVTVAGGMAVAALGTDTGGSIRIPAAFCALTGFKPTARRVPMAGGVPLSTSLDSGGPLANSVDCCAIVDAVLSGQALDTDAVPLAGLRLGLTRDYVAADLDDTVATAFARAVAQLERAGAHIVRFEFPELLQLPEINGGGGLPAAEAWAWHRPHLARAEAQYDRRVAARIRRGEQMSAAAYLDVMAARAHDRGRAQAAGQPRCLADADRRRRAARSGAAGGRRRAVLPHQRAGAAQPERDQLPRRLRADAADPRRRRAAGRPVAVRAGRRRCAHPARRAGGGDRAALARRAAWTVAL